MKNDDLIGRLIIIIIGLLFMVINNISGRSSGYDDGHYDEYNYDQPDYIGRGR